MSHVWICQFWNGTEWRNSMHESWGGGKFETVFIVHKTRLLAKQALAEAKIRSPELLKRTRIRKVELPA